MINRILNLTNYKQTTFLFGPRQTGKTYLIKQTLSPDLYINFLKQSEFLRYAKDVSLLSKEFQAIKKAGKSIRQVIIDEIQRLPVLLNEVHLLIEENPGTQFIMTGSSARKLRRAGVNLLGGRAITLHLHPLTYLELGEAFSVEVAMRYGTLPKIALERDKDAKKRLLKSYVETYLKEEIQQEALTRNLPAFSRFLELAAFENGNLINFKNMSREVGVHAKTIKEYFQILEDTLIGFNLFPFTKSHRERLIAHPKFWFFDCGVVSALRNELSTELTPCSYPYGDAFEHLILLEIKRLIDYRERDWKLSFFRTSDGAEVDIIMDGPGKLWAVEIKSSTAPDGADLRGLKGFIRDHKCDRAVCISQTPRPYAIGEIEVLPWKSFLDDL